MAHINSWQDLCHCGEPKHRYSLECQRCYLKNRKNSCVCGKPKYKTKQLCRDCSSKRDFCACGATKDKRSKVCAVCRGKEPTEKVCRGCRQPLSIGLFGIRPDGRGGHKRRSQCKKCESNQTKQRYKDFPEQRRAIKAATLARQKLDPVRRDRAQKAQWKRQWKKLGLDPEEVIAYIEKYGWVCTVCKREVGHRTRAVDHDHATGKFRGVLCSSCNLALGLFKDSLVLLEAAMHYLQCPPAKE